MNLLGGGGGCGGGRFMSSSLSFPPSSPQSRNLSGGLRSQSSVFIEEERYLQELLAERQKLNPHLLPNAYCLLDQDLHLRHRQSFEQVKKEMVGEKGLSSETADRISTFVKERGQPMELLSKFRQEGSELLTNESSREAFEVFDLSLARGLDYYTGVIFEAVCKGAEYWTN